MGVVNRGFSNLQVTYKTLLQNAMLAVSTMDLLADFSVQDRVILNNSASHISSLMKRITQKRELGKI